MTTYSMSSLQAKTLCDLYSRLGSGSFGNTTTGGTHLAKALGTFVVNAKGICQNGGVSLRQLQDGDIVNLELDPCSKCDKGLIADIGTLNSIFESKYVVPNAVDSTNNPDGVQFCVVIRPTDKCLCS